MDIKKLAEEFIYKQEYCTTEEERKSREEFLCQKVSSIWLPEYREQRYEELTRENKKQKYTSSDYLEFLHKVYGNKIPLEEKCKLDFVIKYEKVSLFGYIAPSSWQAKFLITLLWILENKSRVNYQDLTKKMFQWHLEDQVLIQHSGRLEFGKATYSKEEFGQAIKRICKEYKKYHQYYMKRQQNKCIICGDILTIKIANKKSGRYNLTCNKCLLKNKLYRNNYRDKVLQAYGAKCNCCGIETRLLLTVDHVNNDGAKHRQILSGSIYKDIVEKDFPTDFQILCFNCNCGKYLNGGSCPCPAAQIKK